MPQTKFVVAKALKQGLRPIVVINKVDRSDAEPQRVHNDVFDMFAALGADDDQLDFPTLFASGRGGWAATSMDAERVDMTPLFDLVLEHVKAPVVDVDAPFTMLTTLLEYDSYLGRVLTGRITSGTARVNMPVKALRGNVVVEDGRLSKLLAFRGLERVPVQEAQAGDIIAVAGMTDATVADTLADQSVTVGLDAIPVDPPTIAVTFSVNDSPLAGREGPRSPAACCATAWCARPRATSPSACARPRARTPWRSPAAANCNWAC